MSDNDESNENVGHRFEEGNDAAMKTGLWADDQNFLDNLDPDERKLLGQMAEDFVNKYEEVHGDEPGPADRETIKQLCLDILKRNRANKFMFSQDFINFDAESRHNVYSRLGRDIQSFREDLGLLETPEAKKLNEEADWFELQQEVQDEDE